MKGLIILAVIEEGMPNRYACGYKDNRRKSGHSTIGMVDTQTNVSLNKHNYKNRYEGLSTGTSLSGKHANLRSLKETTISGVLVITVMMTTTIFLFAPNDQGMQGFP